MEVGVKEGRSEEGTAQQSWAIKKAGAFWKQYTVEPESRALRGE